MDTLLAPVLSALLAADVARVEVSWDSPYAVVAPDGSPLAVREAVEAAVDASSSAGLVAWLTECGVDVTTATLAQPRQATWLAAASQMTGRGRDAATCTSGAPASWPARSSTGVS
ncbi:hypothetical protein G7085_00300 [Tessaracoccus sp. HDW20]|uniref:hypothetical protein n=1 Tax=Tessaracoccus coleopterorum TaxID=2714950 RepID=UPI0018D3ADCC|nr:hypothetical protein [Tessaracoccus coleopterorum]NHB83663.1 hypothetical protein [Tessaracoccus coleopterorum]